MTDVAHQLTAGSGKPGQGYPAAITQLGVRRLTPTECERLQGFPDGWTEGLSDTARYRVLGNAVCVPVAEWIGRRILERGL
jgi:DNA (cytosine-5)-methyltransferase 1